MKKLLPMCAYLWLKLKWMSISEQFSDDALLYFHACLQQSEFKCMDFMVQLRFLQSCTNNNGSAIQSRHPKFDRRNW